MYNVIFIILRRLRAPLLLLLFVYSISIAGLVAIPGVDANGQPWRMDFFHAFYFVSFMGTTIGFGEIPHAFTVTQRMWVTGCLYATVISWLFAIGTIFQLVQDPAFVRALTTQRFARAVSRLRDPFYLICGYGETGSLLARSLHRRNIQCVVIDHSAQRLHELALEQTRFDVPHLCCDTRIVSNLTAAGIKKPNCLGVVAMTDDDEANVKIAVTAKLMSKRLRVVSRAQTESAMENLASFHTDHIINAHESFAEHLVLAIRAPHTNLLHAWLGSLENNRLQEAIRPPKGNWILCGFGAFGSAVAEKLDEADIPYTVIETKRKRAPDGAIIGPGTEAGPLTEAGIAEAVGIVAGTGSDGDNLSVIITARNLNQKIYTVARMHRANDHELFSAAKLNLVVEGSRIIVWRILPVLTVPMLDWFLRIARDKDDAWAKELLQRIGPIANGRTPETWSVTIGDEDTPAVHASLQDGRRLTLAELLHDPRDRNHALPLIPLMHVRSGSPKVLPDADLPLRPGDELLLCSPTGVSDRVRWTLANVNALEYVLTGRDLPGGLLWRWLERRRANKNSTAEST